MPSYTQNLGLVKGEKGATGPAGAAATIQIGTVTTGAAGSQAAVTNVGTENAAILNFTIPQGQQGVPGTTPSTDNFVTTDTDQTITGSKTFTSPPTLDADPDGLIATLGSKGRLGSVAGASVEGPSLYANSGSAIYLISQSGVRPKAATGSWLGPQNIEDIAYVSDLSDYVPKTRTINNKALSSNISLTASDVGLSNVANERQYSASNPPPYPVTSVNGETGAVQITAAKIGALTNIPISTATVLGGVKSSTTGTTAGRDYKVQVNTDGTMKVNVPWTDTNTNTTYTFASGSGGSFTVTPSGGQAQTVSTGALTKTQADGYYQPKGNYLTSIPQASTGSLGGIKVGYTTSGKNYAVNVDTSGKAYVNVPWTDTNTTYGVATSSTLGLVKGGTTSGKVYGVSIDGNGAMTVSVPWTDNNTVTNIGVNNTSYTSGNINFVGSGATSVSKSGSTVTISSTNTTYSTFNRSSNGLVPTPGGSTTTRYLREDGTWQVPPNTNTDTKVTQTHSTTNANYPILLKNGTGTGNVTNTTLFDANVYVNPSTGTLTASKVYGAVFNDYAEYRKCETHIDPGYIVTEDGKDCIKLCTTKKNKGKLFVVTDTYGTCIGEKINSVPVALTGRVLVHYDHKRNIKIGDYVGCNDKGQARKMSKIEAFLHPERVVGTVSSIPDYDTWGTDNVKVDGRIWVNIV